MQIQSDANRYQAALHTHLANATLWPNADAQWGADAVRSSMVP